MAVLGKNYRDDTSAFTSEAQINVLANSRARIPDLMIRLICRSGEKKQFIIPMLIEEGVARLPLKYFDVFEIIHARPANIAFRKMKPEWVNEV